MYQYGGGKRKRVTNPDEWICSKEKIQKFQIISEKQFEKAQIIKKSRQEQNKQCEEKNKEYFKYQTKGEMLFTGYIVCGGCGAKLTMRGSKREKKLEDGTIGYTKYYYYTCINKVSGRKCECKKKNNRRTCIK